MIPPVLAWMMRECLVVFHEPILIARQGSEYQVFRRFNKLILVTIICACKVEEVDHSDYIPSKPVFINCMHVVGLKWILFPRLHVTNL